MESSSQEINRFTLPNGLRVIHKQDSATAMVALNVLYNTGARDEDPDMTGLAHLIEHLMFAGSANIPDFDGELQRAGGSSNAWTGNDFTNYYIVIPAVNVEIAYRAESDRMLQPCITQSKLDTQRSVVIEEFKQQCLNRPYGDIAHYMRAMAYRVHPYRWPVIGLTPEHLTRVTLDDVNAFHDRNYSPSNAVLAVTGNITFERCRELCYKWFADIPSRPFAPRQYPIEPLPTSTGVTHAAGNVPYTSLLMTYPMDRRGTTAYYAADAITDVLSNGPSSRFELLQRTLNDTFLELDASILGSEDPGLLMINAKLTCDDDNAINIAVQHIDSQIDKLLNDSITEAELQRAKNKYESNNKFGQLHYVKQALNLAMSELHNENPDASVEKYKDLTTCDVVGTAREIFNPNHRNILIYKRNHE